MFILTTLLFGFSLWLGLYLLARGRGSPLLRTTGLGVVAYAVALTLEGLAQSMTPEPSHLILQWRGPLLVLPTLFWMGSLVYLLPTEHPWRLLAERSCRLGFVPFLLLAALVSLSAGGASPLALRLAPGAASLLLAGVLLVPLLLLTLLVWRVARAERPRNLIGILLVTTLFFGLGMGLLLLPTRLPQSWLLLSLGVDFLLLGVAIAWLDAFDLGEALLPDMLRSLDYAFVLALLFGGQVALMMLLSGNDTPPLRALLLATIATAIAVQVFADPFQRWIDGIAFDALPGGQQLQEERATLRAAADALPRRAATPELLADEPTFARLTRRALSSYGDLPGLIASPLTTLPLVEARLAARDTPDNPLERAQALKALLAESIEQLKPLDGEFGTTDEWRYYNALYFPYVVGLKPYSRRAVHDDLSPPKQEALDWFRQQVPPRTLYNWQNKAAELVAQSLLARHTSWLSSEVPIKES